jgi:hypothetical protein
MNYKQFVLKMFTAWGLVELAIIFIAIVIHWVDTTVNIDEVIGRATLSAAMLVGVIFLFATVSSADNHD